MRTSWIGRIFVTRANGEEASPAALPWFTDADEDAGGKGEEVCRLLRWRRAKRRNFVGLWHCGHTIRESTAGLSVELEAPGKETLRRIFQAFERRAVHDAGDWRAGAARFLKGRVAHGGEIVERRE